MQTKKPSTGKGQTQRGRRRHKRQKLPFKATETVQSHQKALSCWDSLMPELVSNDDGQCAHHASFPLRDRLSILRGALSSSRSAHLIFSPTLSPSRPVRQRAERAPHTQGVVTAPPPTRTLPAPPRALRTCLLIQSCATPLPVPLSPTHPQRLPNRPALLRLSPPRPNFPRIQFTMLASAPSSALGPAAGRTARRARGASVSTAPVGPRMHHPNGCSSGSRGSCGSSGSRRRQAVDTFQRRIAASAGDGEVRADPRTYGSDVGNAGGRGCRGGRNCYCCRPRLQGLEASKAERLRWRLHGSLFAALLQMQPGHGMTTPRMEGPGRGRVPVHTCVTAHRVPQDGIGRRVGRVWREGGCGRERVQRGNGCGLGPWKGGGKAVCVRRRDGCGWEGVVSGKKRWSCRLCRPQDACSLCMSAIQHGAGHDVGSAGCCGPEPSMLRQHAG
eukprot:363395-Chlamydomonas_euryale.AAC.5